MASKSELLAEAERRGLLPEDKKPLLDEARRRGLVAAGEPVTQVPVGDEYMSAETVPVGEIVARETPTAMQAAEEAYRNVAGERTGLDPENYQAVREWLGVLTPLVDAPVAGLEALGGGIDATAAGAARGLSNLTGTNQGTERPERDAVLIARIASLLAASNMSPKAIMGRAAPPKPAKPLTEGQQVAQAAQRQGVGTLPADVAGPGTKWATATTNQTPLGSMQIRRAAGRNLASFADRVDELASQQGNVLRSTDLGEDLQRGARAFITKSRFVGGDLYDDAARAAGNARVTPSETVGALQTEISRLSQTPKVNASQIRVLRRMLDDLTDQSGQAKPMSVEAVRDLRTNTRTSLSSANLRGTPFETKVGNIVGRIGDDIARDLPDDAVSAYRKADRFWRTRVESIDDALVRLLGKDGKLSAESAANRINQIATNRGDSRALQRVMSTLPAEQKRDVVASFVGNLGRRKPEADFSVNTFLTQYQNMSPRAKNLLFKGDLRSALDDLATVAKGVRETQKYANTSNTGSAVAWAATLFSVTDPTLAGTTIGSQLALGRLLSSPRFARWLAKAGKAAEASAKGRTVNMEPITRELAVLSRLPDIGDDVRAVIPPGVQRAAAEEENGAVGQ